MALLLREEAEDVEFLIEGVGEGKNYYIEGIFLQSNVLNKNGRIYPKEILQNEVARYVSTQVSQNRAVGELGHPAEATINLDRTSHKIIDLREDGNNWFGKALILDTPYGKIVKNLLDAQVKLAVSSRGLGSLRKTQSGNVVQSDLKLVTAGDIIHDPSAPSAFVNGIMEGVEWSQDPMTQEWYKQEIETIVTRTKRDQEDRAKRFVSLFEGFLREL